MQYLLFDDCKDINFYPLTMNRSIGDLRVGILKLRQRLADYLKIDSINLIIRDNLVELYRSRHKDWSINKIDNRDCFFINSRLKINKKAEDLLLNLADNSIILNDKNETLAAKISQVNRFLDTDMLSDLTQENFDYFLQNIKNNDSVKKMFVNDFELWEHISDLIAENGQYLKKDFHDYFYDKDNYFEVESGVTVLNPYNIWIGENTELKPGVVLDGSEGPIVIDENVKILSHSVITGPVYIGKNVLVKVGSKIYENTSIGPFSKIGGEVESSIIQAYSNKQHDGFLGHSYLGEWVNLGAGTNNSDLKNNYKKIKMYSFEEKQKVDTGQQFLGAIIGDHTKTGISVNINTGCVLGMASNIYGSTLVKDYVPSFSWGEYGNLKKFEIEKCLNTMEIVKKRRGLDLSEQEKILYRKLYLQELVCQDEK